MSRSILDEAHIHPAIRDIIGNANADLVREVQAAIAAKGWRRRNALKMWTGWPTFPMIFVKGVLAGGAGDLRRLIDSGEFNRMLSSGDK